ncbi:MAG: hypothetical protein ACI8YQ_002421 [Polaribacter sp.]|jgi:hypothetical protein
MISFGGGWQIGGTPIIFFTVTVQMPAGNLSNGSVTLIHFRYKKRNALYSSRLGRAQINSFDQVNSLSITQKIISKEYKATGFYFIT